MKRFIFAFVVLAAITGAAMRGWTQTVTPSQSADPIARQIDSKDPAQIQQAVTTIFHQLQSANVDDRATAILGLAEKGRWLAKIRDTQHYEEVVSLAQAATLAVSSDVRLVEYVQYYRARALLALGRPQEALAVAKGLFNVARMKNVADDLAFIVDCLKVAYPCNDAIIEQFRQEQVAGSVLTNQLSTLNGTTDYSSIAGLRSSVLDGIIVDGSAYTAAVYQAQSVIQQCIASTNYNSVVALGNLLLLSDRGTDAYPIFELAYGLAGSNHVAGATESIARCMKAEDGTIGRANAWLLSISPSTSP